MTRLGQIAALQAAKGEQVAAPGAWVETDPEDLIEQYNERAAISQHDGEESKERAHFIALAAIRRRYRVLKKAPR